MTDLNLLVFLYGWKNKKQTKKPKQPKKIKHGLNVSMSPSCEQIGVLTTWSHSPCETPTRKYYFKINLEKVCVRRA